MEFNLANFKAMHSQVTNLICTLNEERVRLKKLKKQVQNQRRQIEGALAIVPEEIRPLLIAHFGLKPLPKKDEPSEPVDTRTDHCGGDGDIRPDSKHDDDLAQEE